MFEEKGRHAVSNCFKLTGVKPERYLPLVQYNLFSDRAGRKQLTRWV